MLRPAARAMLLLPLSFLEQTNVLPEVDWDELKRKQDPSRESWVRYCKEAYPDATDECIERTIGTEEVRSDENSNRNSSSVHVPARREPDLR